MTPTSRPVPDATVVTGAAGWLGTALMHALTGDGSPWRRPGAIRALVTNRVEADRLRAMGGQVEPVVGDVTDAPSLTPLFDGLPSSIPVWMSHGDRVTQMPPGFSSFAYSDNSPIAGMTDGAGIIGIQFHPEVVHTPHGAALLRAPSFSGPSSI